MPIYALAIFLGAFLVFQVQPLIGKFILPWFGGGPGVWTACMLFFQVALLAGYAYAHVASRWLGPRRQAVVHVILLAAAVALLPITPGNAWKPRGGGNPLLEILLLLTVSVGLPYLVLSSTGPLLQQWFSRVNPGKSPYRLYALSNVGSLLALVSYPFYFEPHFTRQHQAEFWGWGFVVYALVCAFCAVKFWRTGARSPALETGKASAASEIEASSPAAESGNPFRPEMLPGCRPSALHRLLWLSLPACASVLLLAVTNKICQDVAVIPFLWILPLALYLLSFVICFDSPRWYLRFPFTLALIAALGGITWALYHGSSLSVAKQLALYCSGLFVCCMVCHGELYRLRPAAERLTEFYLMIATGGALGGVFVALAAPLAFKDYYELHWGLLGCAFLFICAIQTNGRGMLGCQEAPPAPASRWKPSGLGHSWASNFVPNFVVSELFSTKFGTKCATKLSHSCVVRPRVFGLLAFDYWQWLACVMPFVAFGLLDRLIAQLAQQANILPKGYFIAMRVGMWVILAMLVVSWMARGKVRAFRHWRFLATLWLAIGCVALAVALYSHGFKADNQIVHKSRNFYGVLTVYDYRRNQPEARHALLQHGRITHGLQFADPQRSRWTTTYYGERSGVGLALDALPAEPRRIGLVGLGTGTLSVYGRRGDNLRIYEINPRVAELAASQFSYLRNCPAQVEVVLGDARLSMEHEPPQYFDLLALDAFSSDSIPVHLLTKEAFQAYERHLKTNGIIAIHISNHFLDLEPVVVNLARHFGYRMALVDYDETETEWWLYSSTWMLLTRDEKLLTSPDICEVASPVSRTTPKLRLWTDDFASLFEILK